MQPSIHSPFNPLTRRFALYTLILLFLIAAAAPPRQQTEINPLTGLPTEAYRLDRRPLVVKVSNESNVIRPQTGLSLADHVWEYQMEGLEMTRYTAIFYSRAPITVGSIRSTRLIDVEHLIPMYGGILITSGGSSNHGDPASPPRIEEIINAQPWANRVVATTEIGGRSFGAPYLVRLANLPRRGVPYYHRLFAKPGLIWGYVNDHGLNQRPPLGALAFDDNSPANGIPTTAVSLNYPGVGPRHIWYYRPATRRWYSWTEDQLTGARVERADIDRLNGRQLAFDNIVILYAEHSEADFIEDEAAQLKSIRINLLGEGRAVLLRDGQRFECVWRRSSGESLMQVFTSDGQPLPYKPGAIWYNVTSSNLPGAEVIFAPY
jgi:hypothetical protein